MEFYIISGMLFTIFWLSICTHQSSSDSLSDSVLSITAGTSQFALELLQVSNVLYEWLELARHSHASATAPVLSKILVGIKTTRNFFLMFGRGKYSDTFDIL
jgi:hypothetical protein